MDSPGPDRCGRARRARERQWRGVSRTSCVLSPVVVVVHRYGPIPWRRVRHGASRATVPGAPSRNKRAIAYEGATDYSPTSTARVRGNAGLQRRLARRARECKPRWQSRARRSNGAAQKKRDLERARITEPLAGGSTAPSWHGRCSDRPAARPSSAGPCPRGAPIPKRAVNAYMIGLVSPRMSVDDLEPTFQSRDRLKGRAPPRKRWCRPKDPSKCGRSRASLNQQVSSQTCQ